MKALTLAVLIPFLAGCGESLRLIRVAGHPIVVESSQYEATRARLDAMPYKPVKITPIRHGTSVCYDYQLTYNGEQSPYYVGFRSSGVANAFGMTTCSDAAARGLLSHDNPRKRYD